MESKRCTTCRRTLLLDQFKMFDRHKYIKMCLKCRDQTKKSIQKYACIHGKARFTCRDPECVRKVVLSVEEHTT